MRKRGNRIHHVRRDPTALIRAFGNLGPLPEAHGRKLGIACHLALEAIRQGRGRDADMKQLAYALNIASALCELGVGLDQQASVQAAHNALACVGAVDCVSGRWRIDDAAYRAICEALAIHDLQLEAATQGQIGVAEEMIKARLAAGDVVSVAIASDQTH